MLINQPDWQNQKLTQSYSVDLKGSSKVTKKTQQMFISGDYTLMITQLWLYYLIFSKKDPEILHTGLLTILESFSKETKSENTVRRQKVGKHGHHETDVSVFQFYSIVSMFYK